MQHKIVSLAKATALVPNNKADNDERVDAKVSEPKAIEKLRMSFLCLLTFAVAIPSNQTINLVGELYLTELLLPMLAIGVLFFGKTVAFREKIIWYFVLLAVCLMMGYIVSDLVAGTDSSKYLRAWGRNFILFVDFVSLAIIMASDRRLLWWYALGFSTGTLITLVLGRVPIEEWKFGYAQPITILVLLSAYFVSFRVAALLLVFLAVISIYMDSRSASAFALFVAGVIFLRIKRPEGIKLSLSALIRIIVLGGLLLTLLLVLMNKTYEEYSDRREASSSGRIAALRVGGVAIANSPILGYGSWGEGTGDYASMYYEDMKKKMAELGRRFTEGDVFRPHSQILQSWMEGGFFAAAFFLFFGYQLVKCLKDVVLVRRLDYLSPLYVFFLLISVWHLLMSPYGGGHRLSIALSISIICLLYAEKSKLNRV